MQATKLRDQLGASLRAMAPTDFDTPISMWDLLSAVERAEHEQILQPQADAWAAAHPKLKRPADFDP
jgi:hypothetical protein